MNGQKNDKKYVDISKITIKLINKNDANDMIIKYHYTHTKTLNKYSFGVFYDSKLIGTIIFATPVGRRVVKSISPLLENGEVLEITRVFIFDGYGCNIESFSISQCIKWIKKNDTNIKVIITYADPEQGHTGIIYQSLNFLYQGNKMMLVKGWWFNFDGDSKWYHPRTVVGMYGSLKKKVLLSHHPNGYNIKELKNKHRYILFICNKKLKYKYMSTLKHNILPYPNIENLIMSRTYRITQ